jgi:bifunctional non-homologous end joining protein LigD
MRMGGLRPHGRGCRAIRAALDAKRPIIVDVDHRGLTPAGELWHPVVRAWRV